ncbi:hypothetical protein MBLNU459_g6881t1 [Dothideomycetes sp. NU459]
MEERGKIPPGLPRANPTTSYWQDPPDPIAEHRSTTELPPTADYVIIGSGISGASIAYHLLERDPSASIIMLEARTASSGATGRNGGHTKAASYRSFASHESSHGLADAIKIARLEHATIRATHALAASLDIACASTPCDTVDIVLSARHLAAGEAAIGRMRATMGAGDPAARYEVCGAAEARRRFAGAPAGVLGAFVYEAGSVSAYRFAVGLLRVCLRRGLRLYTRTAALSVARRDGGGGWAVETERGTVAAGRVVLATNGYTAHLIPALQGLIVPLRGQVSAQRPGSKLAEMGLETTYSFIYEKGYEYMISRPPGTEDVGTVVIGGGLGTLPQDGASEFGETDDGALHSGLSAYLRDCTERYFESNWGEDAAEGRVKKEWSGIMGTSADGLPYVGEIPDAEGLWICASFNGHGMVLCLKCAEALVDMMVGGERKERLDGWFPKAFRMTKERLENRFEGRLDMKPPGEAMFKET